MAHSGSMKAVFYALTGNSLIAIIKFIVAFITTSSAMLAEAIHSVADCLNQIFLLIGEKRSKKKANELHSFGFQRESFFWSLMVAILLFFVGSIFSVYEGIHKVMNPEDMRSVHWIFIVLVISILIEAKTFSVAYKEFRKKYKQKKLHKAIEDSTDTNLIVILLEDFAALTGLFIVLITTLLSFINPFFDAIGSILVGLLLATISFKLANEIRKLIVGESISREERLKIKRILQQYNIIEHINRIQTMVMGNDKYMVLISVNIDDESIGYHIENIFNEIKTEIKKEIPQVETIYLDIQDYNK